MGVYKRADSPYLWYTFKIEGQEKVNKSTRTSDGKLAEGIYHKKYAEALKVGHEFKRERVTLASVLDYYLEEHINVKTDPNNRLYYKYLFDDVNAFFGNMDVHDMSLEDILRWEKKRMREGVAHITIDKEVGAIRAAFKLRIAVGVKIPNPTEGFKYCTAMEKRMRRIKKISLLNDKDFECFMGYCPLDLARFLIFFYSTGWRPAEILDVKWADLNFEKNTIMPNHRKGGMDMETPVSSNTMDMLKEMPRLGTHVFGNNGGKVGWTWYRKRFEKARGEYKAKENRPHFRLYDLRHSYVTFAIERGESAKTISEMLGHTTPTMVNTVYTHVTLAAKRVAAEMIPKRVFARLDKEKAGYAEATDVKSGVKEADVSSL